MTETAFAQGKYQVRFDWGAEGLRRIGSGAHVVVLVDALSFTTTVVLAAERGEASAVPEHGPLADPVRAVAGSDTVVLAASLRNRSAVAERIVALQEERGERLMIAVVAAGETDGGVARFAIEDQLTAGAVIDALVTRGIDHTSPEAAVASAAWEGLAKAAVHLIAASGSGVELTERGHRADVKLATARDVTQVVPQLRDGVFRA